MQRCLRLGFDNKFLLLNARILDKVVHILPFMSFMRMYKSTAIHNMLSSNV